MRLLPFVLILLSSAVAPVWAGTTFGPSIPISNTLTRASQVVSTDLDGDGDLDLLASGVEGSQVVWWSNDGKGNFGRAGEWFRPNERTKVLRLADFDGDGKIDLLLATDSPTVSEVTDYAICPSLGMLGFGPPGVGLPFTDDQVVIQDLNSDGRPDFMTPTGTWINQGGGQFTANTTSPLPWSIFPTLSQRPQAWVDTDGDDRKDAFVFNTVREIQCIRYLGAGGFSPVEPLVTVNRFEVELHSVELIPVPQISAVPCILAFENRDQLYTNRRTLSLYVKSGDAYVKAASADFYKLNRNLTIDQLIKVQDGDQFRYLIRAHSTKALTYAGTYNRDSITEVRVVASRGKAAFALKILAEPPAPCPQPLFADLNGDNLSDLLTPLTSAGTFSQSIREQLTWFPAKRGGLFERESRAINQPATEATLRFAGDLDGDGDVDLLTQLGKPAYRLDRTSIVLWRNSGQAASFDRLELFNLGNVASVVAVTDRNGDGRPDILIRCTTYTANQNDLPINNLIELTAQKNGTYRQSTLVSEKSREWEDVELRDGNRDGIPDLRIFTYGDSHWIPALDRKRFAKPGAAVPGIFPKDGEFLCDPDWDGDLDVWTAPSWSETNPDLAGLSHPTPTYGSFEYLRELYYFGKVFPVDFDFDGDGHPDYVSTQNSSQVPLLADRATEANNYYPLKFDPEAIIATPGFLDEVTNYLDVDGDGDLDVVYAVSTIGLIPARLVWRENLGGIHFSAEREIAPPITSGRETVACTDLDGDGILDLVCSSKTNATRLEWFKGVRSSP